MSSSLRFCAARVLCTVVVFVVVGCGGDKNESSDSVPATIASEEPVKEADYITVQHVLIAFQGSVPGKPVTRSQAQAQALAEEIYQRAQNGEDFGVLVKEYTDDSFPGIYKMANFGVPGDRSQQIYERQGMVAAFGDVGFPLEVGGVGLAEYDPQKSKYGWHIIKRVE